MTTHCIPNNRKPSYTNLAHLFSVRERQIAELNLKLVGGGAQQRFVIEASFDLNCMQLQAECGLLVVIDYGVVVYKKNIYNLKTMSPIVEL